MDTPIIDRLDVKIINKSQDELVVRINDSVRILHKYKGNSEMNCPPWTTETYIEFFELMIEMIQGDQIYKFSHAHDQEKINNEACSIIFEEGEIIYLDGQLKFSGKFIVVIENYNKQQIIKNLKKLKDSFM